MSSDLQTDLSARTTFRLVVSEHSSSFSSDGVDTERALIKLTSTWMIGIAWAPRPCKQKILSC